MAPAIQINHLISLLISHLIITQEQIRAMDPTSITDLSLTTIAITNNSLHAPINPIIILPLLLVKGKFKGINSSSHTNKNHFKENMLNLGSNKVITSLTNNK